VRVIFMNTWNIFLFYIWKKWFKKKIFQTNETHPAELIQIIKSINKVFEAKYTNNY